ncbi:MAG: PEP-CTERM sorting domain-containing protein [Planctomycetota bacterium]
MMSNIKTIAAGVTLAAGFVSGASAQVSWTNWTDANAGAAGSASGNMGGVFVRYTGEVLFAQTNGAGTNYWQPDAAYLSATVPNAPANADIIAITGGNQTVNTITFSQAITDPIMAIVSMGQGGLPVDYVFDASFSILSVGQGYWGNGTLVQPASNILRGEEGHGVIQFQGSFTSISFVVPTGEYWHGFSVGMVPTPGSMALLGLGGVVSLRRRR